jgi:hypothetical protein
MGHWPINRRCANKLRAYGVLPILGVKTHYRTGGVGAINHLLSFPRRNDEF